MKDRKLEEIIQKDLNNFEILFYTVRLIWDFYTIPKCTTLCPKHIKYPLAFADSVQVTFLSIQILCCHISYMSPWSI